MPITDKYLKGTGLLTAKGSRKEGCWEFSKMLQVVASKNSPHGPLVKGKTYLIRKYDEDGKYPGCVFVHDIFTWTQMKNFNPVKGNVQ